MELFKTYFFYLGLKLYLLFFLIFVIFFLLIFYDVFKTQLEQGQLYYTNPVNNFELVTFGV